MKINLQDHLRKNDIVSWAIIHMITAVDPKLNNPKLNPIRADGELDTENTDIVLTINGVEIDFVQCIKDIEAQNDRIVLIRAKEMVSESFDDVYSKAEEMKTLMDEIIQKKKQELGWN